MYAYYVVWFIGLVKKINDKKLHYYNSDMYTTTNIQK